MGVVGDDDVQDLEHVRHRAGVGHHHVHGGHQRPVAPHGDDPARWRVGAQPVVRRGRAPGGPRLLPEPEARERRRRGRPGAVGGPRSEGRREVVLVVRALGAPVHPALHTPVGHGRHVGQTQQDGPARAQPLDREGVPLRHEVPERRRSRGDREPPRAVAVLRGVRDTVQRAQGLAALAASVRRPRLLEGVGSVHDHGVQADAVTVVCRDAPLVRQDQFLAGHLPRLERSAQLCDRGLHDVDVAHARSSPDDAARGAGCCWVMQWIPPPKAKMSRASTSSMIRSG